MSYAHYLRIFDNANKPDGRIDRSGTLSAWKQRAMVTRSALEVLRGEYEKEVAKVNTTYKPAAAAERIRPLREDFDEVAKIAKDRVLTDLNAVLAAKRQALSRSQDAPSEDVVRLLTVLKMRTSLTDAEVAEAAGKMHGNLPALAALRDIAEKSGVTFPRLDVEDMEQNLERAESFALSRIESIDKATDDLGYMERLFWADVPGEAATIFGAVDGAFTSPLEQPKPMTPPSESTQPSHVYSATPIDVRTSTTRGADGTKIYLRGGEGIGTIAAQFGVTLDQIRRFNPEADLYDLKQGDTVIVPGTRMSVFRDNTRAVVEDQCVPISLPAVSGDGEG